MTQVLMATCASLAEFRRFAAPLTMSRHMVNFFNQKTHFNNPLHQPDGYDVRYLASDTQVLALWVSAVRDYVRLSYGTYVEKSHRRMGLASLLWAHEVTANIYGTSCSTEGYRFLSALRKSRRNVCFVDHRAYV